MLDTLTASLDPLEIASSSERIDLVLGDSAAGTLRHVYPDCDVVALVDDLTTGPHTLTYDLEARVAWWQTNFPEPYARFSSPRTHEWDTLADRAILWFNGGVGEQMHLCWAAHHLVEAGARSVRLAHPLGVSHASMIAACSPDQLARARAVTLPDALVDLASSLWRAFCEPTPSRFHELARRVLDEDALTRALLGDLHLLLHRLPSPEDGLDVWDRRLLERIAANPGESTARTVGHVMGEAFGETADHLGDRVLLGRLNDLASAGCLTRTGAGHAIRDTTFALTGFGERVLAGDENRVLAPSFRRWLGGTRSGGGSAVWWFDGEAPSASGSH